MEGHLNVHSVTPSSIAETYWVRTSSSSLAVTDTRQLKILAAPRGHNEPKHIEATEAEIITLRAGMEKPLPPVSGRPEGGGRGQRPGA